MDKSPDNILNWLTANQNSMMTITKNEDDDQDIAELKLKDVNLIHNNDPNNYLSAQALLLIGVGTVETNFGKVPLPDNVYEISLTDKWSVKADDNIMYLHTERGTYTIESKTRFRVP